VWWNVGQILEGRGGGALVRGGDGGMNGWVVGRVCWAVVTLRGWGWRWVGLGWVDLDGFGRILFKLIEWIEFDLDCTGLFLFQSNKVNPTKQSRPSIPQISTITTITTVTTIPLSVNEPIKPSPLQTHQITTRLQPVRTYVPTHSISQASARTLTTLSCLEEGDVVE